MHAPKFLIIVGILGTSLLGIGACDRGSKRLASDDPAASEVGNTAVVEPSLGGPLSAVWVNDGGDKVTRDELRATQRGSASVKNSLWNGARANLFGAKNEVVSFNLVLESARQESRNVKVHFEQLVGPNDFTIRSTPATGNAVFNWTNRDIELFAVKYLQIKGLSKLSYGTYDERHIPARFRRPGGAGTWADRPDRDKFYPDIAVPLELSGGDVQIAADQNQSVWVDIYIPKDAPAGFYTGRVILSQGEKVFREVPVDLVVKNFALPDMPKSKTMLELGYEDIIRRYLGTENRDPPAPGSNAEATLRRVRDRHFQMAHRHKISLIDADKGAGDMPDHPRAEWLPRLSGELYSVAKGYRGPGMGVGNNIYSIGTFGSWDWKANVTQASMRTHTDAWVNWFQNNFPNTEYFLYLIDESNNYTEMQQWAQWIKDNPGVGKSLPSFATLGLPAAIDKVPALSIAAFWFTVGVTRLWEDAYARARSASPAKKVFAYNGKRPSNGSFATEDDGVALRELSWAQYKKRIDRWFFWESTYYNDFQGGRGETNVFKTAATFSSPPTIDPTLGETGWNHSNGDGLLFYPGTDKVFAAESLNLEGPIASLRLKHWRRGVQDVDYIALAAAVNPTATQAIVNRMVPKAMWDYGVTDAGDPTWVRTDISWSTDPNDWEAARKNLADIIEGKPVAAN